MPSHILLRNATILVPSGGPDDYVQPLWGHSLLITDKRISKLASEIEAPSGTEVIDCTNKIISPGFIDTHHHLWQTQLKGRHANHTLLEYMPNGIRSRPNAIQFQYLTTGIGNNQHVNYAPEDVFWGVLGGSLEALDAGTTTVVDHAHMNGSPAHGKPFAVIC